MTHEPLWLLIAGDTPATTEGWCERLRVMKRGGSDMRWLPTSPSDLARQLADLEQQGVLKQDSNGQWVVNFDRRTPTNQQQELFR